jgi:hypothetical protein
MKSRKFLPFFNRAFLILFVTVMPVTYAKDNWPVKKFDFTYAGKGGWKPASAKVKEGSEVQIKLKNSSSAPACFGVFNKDGKDISGGACAQAKAEKSFVFFANFPKGKYEIRNSYESAGVGSFIIE